MDIDKKPCYLSGRNPSWFRFRDPHFMAQKKATLLGSLQCTHIPTAKKKTLLKIGPLKPKGKGIVSTFPTTIYISNNHSVALFSRGLCYTFRVHAGVWSPQNPHYRLEKTKNKAGHTLTCDTCFQIYTSQKFHSEKPTKKKRSVRIGPFCPTVLVLPWAVIKTHVSDIPLVGS